MAIGSALCRGSGLSPPEIAKRSCTAVIMTKMMLSNLARRGCATDQFDDDSGEKFMAFAASFLQRIRPAHWMGRLSSLSPLLRWPGAWLAFGISFIITAWAGWGSVVGMLVAVLVSATIAVGLFLLAQARERIAELASDLAASRANEARLQAMLDHLPGLVWTSNGHGERMYVSAAWQRMTGRSDPKAAPLDWTELVHAEDQQVCRSTHRIACAGGEAYDMEYRMRQADGEYRWMLDRGASYRDAQGSPCGLIGVTIDITERKGQEEEMRRRIDELIRRAETLSAVNERAAALVDRFEAMDHARQEAQNNDRLKSEFLEAVALDLRKPIEDVCNVAGLLRAGELSAQQKLHVDRMKDAAGSLSAALGRAVELAGAGDADLSHPSDFDLRLLVDKITERMILAAEERGLTVDCEVDKSLPAMVKADAPGFRRVFSDLWTAASQMRRSGLIRLKITRQTRTSANSLISVAIVIKGRGVPQERLDRAFYPAEAIKRELVGLGLGPAKRIVEQMGGQIGVNRDQGGDVVFWFSVNVTEVNPHCDGRRVQARLTQESLRSNLGPVLDLSMGGMRVRCNKLPEGIFDVELSDEEETIHLRAEVAWARRVGFRRQEVGLKFVDLSPDLAIQLSRLAARNRIRHIIQAA